MFKWEDQYYSPIQCEIQKMSRGRESQNRFQALGKQQISASGVMDSCDRDAGEHHKVGQCDPAAVQTRLLVPCKHFSVQPPFSFSLPHYLSSVCISDVVYSSIEWCKRARLYAHIQVADRDTIAHHLVHFSTLIELLGVNIVFELTSAKIEKICPLAFIMDDFTLKQMTHEFVLQPNHNSQHMRISATQNLSDYLTDKCGHIKLIFLTAPIKEEEK
ncbi:uncharacterized protein V6R79_016447 [Siganus canaliculatus]